MYRFYLFIYIIQNVVATLDGQFSWDLKLVNTTINTQTNYILVISILYQNIASNFLIPNNSYIRLTFPNQYPSTVFNTLSTCDQINDGCNTCQNFNPCLITKSTTANTITFSNAFYNISTLYPNNVTINFTLKNILNPSSPDGTAPFNIQIIDTLTNILYSDSSSISLSFKPALMSCTITLNNSLVQAKNTMMNIEITPKNPVSLTSLLTITFPSKWPNNYFDTGPLNTSSTFVCANIINASSSISCGFKAFSTTVINVNNAFISVNQPNFKFSFSPIINPPSTQPIGGIEIATLSTNLNKIDVCYPLITASTPATILNPSLNLISSSGLAYNTSVQGIIQFTTSLKHEINDKLQIVFPSSIGVSSIFNYYSGLIFYNFQISANTLDIFLYINSSNIHLPQTYSITLNKLISPPSNLSTGNIVITFYRYGYIMETITCCSLTINAPNILVSPTITAMSYKAGDTTQYNITITTIGSLSINGGIQLLFPSNFSLSNIYTNCTGLYSTHMAISPVATCNISNNYLTISNIFNSTPQSAVTLSIITPNITNPSKGGTTNPIVIRTIYDTTTYQAHSSGYVDIYSALSLTLLTTSITNVNITLSSYNVYNEPTNITFSITNKNSLLNGTYLQIQVPSDFQQSGIVLCYYNGISLTNTNCQITGNLITMAGIINSTIPAGQMNMIPIVLTNFINPQSCSPTNNFTVILYDNSSNAIQSWIGSSLFMITPTVFDSISIVPLSFVLGAITTYTIQLTVPFIITNNSYLTLNFSGEIWIQSTTCTNKTNLNAVNCSANNNPISLYLPLKTSTAKNFAFTLSNIQNPLSKSNSQFVTISLYLNSSLSSLSLQSTYNISQNILFTPNLITYTVSNTWPYFGQPTSLIFTINTTNQIPPNFVLSNPGYIIIALSPDFTLNSIFCQSFFGISNPSCIINSNQITITGTQFNFTISVTIGNITNPTNVTNNYTTILSYDNSSFIIDQSSTNYKFQLYCSSPCRTCSNTSTTTCYSCYNSSINTFNFLQNSTCKTSCNIGYYNDSNQICQACLSLCQSCTNLTVCTSCISNAFLVNKLCYSYCPKGYYNDTTSTCTACSTNCSICTSQSSVQICQLCINGNYLYQNACSTSSCPSSTYTDSNNICQNCPDNCITCILSSSSSEAQCTVCDTSVTLYILYAGLCWSQCPNSLFLDITNCAPCSSTCYSCSVIPTNCTSCNFSDPIYTYLETSTNTCINPCSIGYYPDISVCVLCVIPCQTCNSLTNCTSCISSLNLVLYNNTCILSCPSGITVNITNVCLSCTFPCITCSITQTNCTSCNYLYVLNGTKCSSSCTLPLIAINGTCQYCQYPCNNSASACVSSTYYYLCYYCVSGYYIYNQTCFTTCPLGTRNLNCSKCIVGCTLTSTCSDVQCFFCSATQSTLKIQICVDCPAGCASCTNLTICYYCIQGYYLYNGICYHTCSYPNFPGIASGLSQGVAHDIAICTPCNTNFCESCISSPTKCTACKTGRGLLYNNITKICRDSVIGCYDPATDIEIYYQSGADCIPCQLPCTSCYGTFNNCTSCYIGMYLMAVNSTFNNCTNTCNIGYYFSQLNTCQPCYNLCMNCSQNACSSCKNGFYLLQGNCTQTCIEPKPYGANGVCTNCINVAYCLQCFENQCSHCVTNYFLFKGNCIQQCPINYQADQNKTMCIVTLEYANHLAQITQSKKRNIPFIFTMIFIAFLGSLFVSWMQSLKCYYIGSLLSIVGLLEVGSWILLIIFLILYGSQVWYCLFVCYALIFLNIFLNGLNLIPIFKVFKEDPAYIEWQNVKKNRRVQTIIISLSIFTNFKFTRILFSRYYDLPFFCSRLESIQKFSFWNKIQLVSTVFLELPFIAISAIIAYSQQQTTTKVFIQCLQVMFLTFIGCMLNIANYRKKQVGFFKQNDDDPLKNVSNRQVKGFSELGDEDDVAKIKRTRSEGKLNADKTQFQKFEDDYISVYDPSDYQDVPIVHTRKISKGLQKGKFRRKNKKKLQDLQCILEIPQYQDEQQVKKKKKFKNKKKGKGSVVDLLYWKAPPIQTKLQKIKKKDLQKKKKQEQKLQFESKVYETIRNKESQFDLLSKRQDFNMDVLEYDKSKKQNTQRRLFHETTRRSYFQQDKNFLNIIPNDLQMSQDQLFEQEQIIEKNVNDDSNNFIFTFDPDDLMNLNYAKKKHIQSKKNLTGMARLGGMTLGNFKK